MRPKVSVSVVTYNHESFLGECLAGLVAQKTDFPFEIVVGEDCSTDGTAQVLERFAREHPEVVKPIFHRPNVGVRRNWQAVLDACRGDYIAHVDGDDRALPGKLQAQADLLDRDPQVSHVFHPVRVFDSATGATLAVTPRSLAAAPRSFDDFLRRGTTHSAATSSKMFRRAALPAGGLDGQIQMMLDWSTNLAAALHGEAAYLPEILGEYRVHKASAMRVNLAGWERHKADLLRTVSLARAWGAREESAREAESWIHLHLADRYLLAGERAAFQRELKASYAHGSLTRAHAVRRALEGWPRTLRGVLRAANGAYALLDRLRG